MYCKIFFEIFIELLLKYYSVDGIITLTVVNGRYAEVNSGTACKNLTDGLLIAMAILALIGLVVEFMSFDGEHIMNHPTTSEDITV